MVTKKFKLRPLSDRVVIHPLEAEDVTASGIVIPDTASKEKPQKGEVEAVGPGRFNATSNKVEPMEVKVGDIVIFSKYSGDEVKIDGVEYKIIAQDSILAVEEK
ncbi:co-chaperone GroES [Candidatus Peregrinibacteria bacterium CG08_land_8_20_14_0_20_41_10]|nr:MAG: co-chaperone GroES [Candidatus Peregrinibacteria bacterium CG1_02_41_10]PIS32308.1 MAG: co-chaperone GroES [Candidatus Peregrinibacteria bacterium CG08_land_8_20_14_0_20_41_10]